MSRDLRTGDVDALPVRPLLRSGEGRYFNGRKPVVASQDKKRRSRSSGNEGEAGADPNLELQQRLAAIAR